jgi:hypothetical protein
VDFYDIAVSNYLPSPAGASLRVDDVLTIFGPDPTYDLSFTWDIAGSASSTNAEYVNSDWRLVMNAPGIAVDRLVSFGKDNQTWSQSHTFVLRGIPSNTPVSYFYFAFAFTWMKDCIYDRDHTFSCNTPATYSASQRIDFGSTFGMTNFSILRVNGELAEDVAYSSQNGLSFPGDVQAIPEPSSLSLVVLAAGMLIAHTIRYRCSRTPVPWFSTAGPRQNHDPTQRSCGDSL